MTHVLNVVWRGRAPTAAIAIALAEAGYSLREDAGAEEACPVVVCTASSRRLPGAPSRGRWIWVSAGPLTDERQLQAALAGAYDAISLDEPDAATTIAARLAELAVPEPALPPAESIALRSEERR